MKFWMLLAGGVAAVVIGSVGYAALSDRSADQTPVARPPSQRAFAEDDNALPPGPTRGLFSPDGRQVAVLDDGAVALASQGALKRFTPSAANIVDFAWTPDSNGVLVAEGPIPTGQLSVLGLDGAVKGTTRLQPSIGFGAGYGMSVDSTTARAAVIAVTRDPIGGREHTDLAVVELATGTVRTFESPGNERRPVFVDDERIAVFFESSGNDGVSTGVAVVDLATGERKDLPTRAANAVLGATTDGEVVVAEASGEGQRIVAIAPDDATRTPLAALAPPRRAVACDPGGLRLLASESTEVPNASGSSDTVSRLVAVDLPQRSASEGDVPG